MIATILTVIVAALHAYFLFVEMFQWESPRARKALGTSPEFAKASRVLAANQGLYNGFLAAGLLFSIWWADQPMQLFLLACVVVAGAYGAATANSRIFFIQGVPAVLAILAVVFKL